MTNAFLARFDAIARQSFARAGVADAATFKLTPASDPVACTVYVDRDIQRTGFEAGSSQPLTTISAPSYVIQRPIDGESSFTVGAETFVVDAVIASDEGHYLCSVVPNG